MSFIYIINPRIEFDTSLEPPIVEIVTEIVW